MSQSVVFERTAEKQQLRNLLNSLAQEAQQRAYELKAAKVLSVLEGDIKIHEVNTSSEPAIASKPKRSRARMSDIEELAMEDEIV
jgi:hypothetical protein